MEDGSSSLCWDLFRMEVFFFSPSHSHHDWRRTQNGGFYGSIATGIIHDRLGFPSAMLFGLLFRVAWLRSRLFHLALGELWVLFYIFGGILIALGMADFCYMAGWIDERCIVWSMRKMNQMRVLAAACIPPKPVCDIGLM